MYVREAGQKKLTFVVSGMLWNRSLVMMDLETKSEWSHILGRAMKGKLKGSELEAIPSVMTDWVAWRRDHPNTTVMNLSRARDWFYSDFYQDAPDFVYGWQLGRQAYHCPLGVLRDHPVLNLDLDGWSLVVTHDPGGTGIQMFNRKVGDRTLTFDADGEHRMRDRKTSSVWSRNTGEALEGPLKATRLRYEIGMMSYKKAWDVFHPDSRPVSEQDQVGGE